MAAKKRPRRSGIKSVVAPRESVILDAGGEPPVGICALSGCLGEAARVVMRFHSWEIDLTHSRLPYVATPRGIGICRGCFEKGAS